MSKNVGRVMIFFYVASVLIKFFMDFLIRGSLEVIRYCACWFFEMTNLVEMSSSLIYPPGKFVRGF